ncbi:MAG TPA: hypothetical protein VFA33_18425 [Bryobacteraceae bacterium]|nr:hypothetical protein [Bryobacteraceae bacterium]
MSREEIEKLLGGYATDTLTEAERRALCEAALTDQALFDQLAREQALRELLQDPQARQQLLEALATRPAVAPRRRFAWWGAAAALAATGSLAVVGVFVYRRTALPPPVRMARLAPPAAPEIQAAPPVNLPAARPEANRKTAAPAARKATAQEMRTAISASAGMAGVAGYVEAPRTGVAPAAILAGGPPEVRYQILLGDAPAGPGTVFRAGDAVRLRLLPGEDGYLYVIEQTAPGLWRLAFSGAVSRDVPVLIPTGGPLRYSAPGRKTWLAVLSRQPEPAVESLAPERLALLERQARERAADTLRFQPTAGLPETAVSATPAQGAVAAVEIPLDIRE